MTFTKELLEHYPKELIQHVKAVIADRDGTINVSAPRIDDINTGYVLTPDDFHLIEGAGKGLFIFQELGITTHIFTQQKGVAKGLLSEDNLAEIHQHMSQLLEVEHGVKLGNITFCPHKDNSCITQANPCAKLNDKEAPEGYLGQFREHLERTGLEPKEVLVIGDALRDAPPSLLKKQGMLFVGVRNTKHPEYEGQLKEAGYLVADNILQIAQAIKEIKSK